MTDQQPPQEPAAALAPQQPAAKKKRGKQPHRIGVSNKRKVHKKRRHWRKMVGVRGNTANLKYQKQFAETAHHLALLGYTDENIAASLRISVPTFYAWKKRYPEFRTGVDGGRDPALGKVASKLHQLANGFTAPKEIAQIDMHQGKNYGTVHRTVVAEQVHPNLGAIKSILSNRTDLWKDKSTQEVTGANGAPLVPVQIVIVSDAGSHPRAIDVPSEAVQLPQPTAPVEVTVRSEELPVAEQQPKAAEPAAVRVDPPPVTGGVRRFCPT